ncbi:hypothetical protein QNO08_10635 [Arthrobacter sp. zg-Y820]|uniref:hypothetical protein n=1 Tax=unclassified Arthrobacter TaxID=235627 RepID=UPI001E5B8419|nr:MULTISPECIES: hypothetical protein [unclassified Arthrobacter]MCC9196421.1 hypothetical protein [Arthrobacter sp. zg-Y820]MDK1279283.1 hypothetical protein [Arthrobacter sp. zg.Y820]WIB08324.1 hypothetical protein QNO08_10635 [Arthrobacter sp. zg-Y820]
MIALTHAPHDLVVGTSDGIDVRFAGVEFKDAPDFVGVSAGEPGIHVHLSGVRGKETMSRDGRFNRGLEEWWKRREAAGSDRSENPPPMPGVAVFEGITTVVSDDIGTEYRRSGGQTAGSGMEWDALWVYTPAPPAEARTLRLEFSVGGELTGKYCEFSLSNPISADGLANHAPH